MAEVDFATVFDDAQWVWIPVVIVFSQMPQIGSAIAMLGSVSQPLPMRPVVAVKFANNFTGLVGGGVATMALVVRFFQRQGLGAAVAVSSGLLNAMASGICEVVFVAVGLLFTGASFSVGSSGGSGSGRLLILAILVVGTVSGLVVLLPRLRRKVGDLVRPQIESARANLRHVLSEPRKGLQLFGGNVIAQVFFALTLWAALETYGQSLGLMELIVINSFASVSAASPRSRGAWG